MDAVENDPASYQPVSLICRVYLTGKLTRMPPVLRGESVEQLRVVAPQQRDRFRILRVVLDSERLDARFGVVSQFEMGRNS